MIGIYGKSSAHGVTPIKNGDSTKDHYLYYDGENVMVYNCFNRVFDESLAWPSAFVDLMEGFIKNRTYVQVYNEVIIAEVMTAL